MIVTIGMCSARAIAFTRWTSGVTFWLLNTHTLISRRRAWCSTVSVSFALTSVPSAIAFAKPYGVRSRRPRLLPSGAKMLSL